MSRRDVISRIYGHVCQSQRRSCALSCSTHHSRSGGGQADRECRTRAGLALQEDAAAHCFAQVFGDRKPQTGAAELSRRGGVCLGERLK